jgi:RNA polymerase sigma factor (sigma-70 family)
MPTDSDLLAAYIDSGSQSAFTALVERHLPAVCSAAARQVGGNNYSTQEVVQTVFTLLARKAQTLRSHPALIAWLYTTTSLTAAKMRRQEARRSRRETLEANMEDKLVSPDAAIDWDRVGAVIDPLLLQLSETDRAATLLRFFEHRPYREIGDRFGISENAARMRVERALEGLRSKLARLRIKSTAAAVGIALGEHAVLAAPVGMAPAIAATAVASAAAAPTVLTFVMVSSLLKIAVPVAFVAMVAGLLIQRHDVAELRTSNVQLQSQVSELKRQRPPQSVVANRTPTAPPNAIAPHLAPSGPPPAPVGPVQIEGNRDPLKGLTKIEDFRNLGRATPADAFQTIVWAAVKGDPELENMLFLNGAARAQADKMIAGLPEKERTNLNTPEKLAALYLMAQLDSVKTLQVVNVRPYDFETYEIDVASGERGSGTALYSLQATPTGWMLKIPAARLARFEQELKSAPVAER